MNTRDRHDPSLEVPQGVRVATAWAWRLLVIAAAIGLGAFLISKITLVVIPLVLAALLSALLLPAVDWLATKRVPRPVSAALIIILMLLLVSGLIWIVVGQVRSGYPDLQLRAIQFWESTKDWLANSPLHVSSEDLRAIGDEIIENLRKDARTLLTSALSWGTTAGQVLAGGLLTLFSLLFLLMDGQRIWGWLKGIFPRASRPGIDGSARAGWVTLGNFMRVQVLVAGIDALGIGIGAALLGVPLAAPIAILVFLGSFIPVIGAVVTGTLAVFVALIALGPWQGLIMLGIVLAVQQIEGHVLQPLVMGSAVKIHPLGVVLAVTAGSIIAGIPGALFAVPVTAFVNVFVATLMSGDWKRLNAHSNADEIDELANGDSNSHHRAAAAQAAHSAPDAADLVEGDRGGDGGV